MIYLFAIAVCDCPSTQVFSSLVRVKCECYGVSGSCDLKTCWRRAPTIQEVAKTLFKHYRSALRTRRQFLYPSRDGNLPLTHRQESRTPKKDQLVFMKESPDFCVADSTLGLLGTAGRQCELSFTGTEGSCFRMCCNNGYDTTDVEETVCECRHIFCCRRVCENCRTVVKTVHRCSSSYY